VRWLQHELQAHIGAVICAQVSTHLTYSPSCAAVRVQSLHNIMKCSSLSVAQQRQDAGWTSGRSRDRCLIPVFLFLGQSASSCILMPVPLHSHLSSQKPLLPKIIISSSSTPGITIITPHCSSIRISSSSTDSDGYQPLLFAQEIFSICTSNLYFMFTAGTTSPMVTFFFKQTAESG
jgi:hypothetical protein